MSPSMAYFSTQPASSPAAGTDSAGWPGSLPHGHSAASASRTAQAPGRQSLTTYELAKWSNHVVQEQPAATSRLLVALQEIPRMQCSRLR